MLVRRTLALIAFFFLATVVLSGCTTNGPLVDDLNAQADPVRAFEILSLREKAVSEIGLSYVVQPSEFPIGPEPPTLFAFEWRKNGERKTTLSSDALGTRFHTMVADSNARRVRCTEGGFFSTRARCSVESASAVRSELDALSLLDQLDRRAVVRAGRPLVLGSRPCDTFEVFAPDVSAPRLLGLEKGEKRPMSIEVCLDHEKGFVHWLEARVPENVREPDWNRTRAVLKVRLVDVQFSTGDENLRMDYPLSIGPVSCDAEHVEFDLLPLADLNQAGVDLIDPDRQIIRSFLVPVQVEPFFNQSISLQSDFNAKAVRVCDLSSKYCIGVACLGKSSG